MTVPTSICSSHTCFRREQSAWTSKSPRNCNECHHLSAVKCRAGGERSRDPHFLRSSRLQRSAQHLQCSPSPNSDLISLGCKCKLQSWIRSLCDTHHLLPTSGDAEHKYYTCYSSMSQGLHAGVSIFNRHAARSEDCVSLAQLTLPYQPIKSNRYRLNTAKYNRASLRHVKGTGKDPCTSPSTSGWELLPVQMQFERGESLLCCPQTAAGRQHCTHCPAWTAEPSEMCQH